jgi:hypothetical protein
MKQTSIYGYFAFGYNYGLIKRNGLAQREVKEAEALLVELLELLDGLDLQVSRKIATELEEVIEELKSSTEGKVSPAQSERIKKVTDRLDPALDAELELRATYTLTKKRYPLESLLYKPSELLASGTYATLDDTSKRDFNAACLQIALAQPTAAAFHLMRALEQQVKLLYFGFKKTDRLEKPMWGPMTQQLRTKKAPRPSVKLLDQLDGMRVHFRNPTQHPDAFYNIDEAQDLLSQTIAAMNGIAAELPKPKSKTA